MTGACYANTVRYYCSMDGYLYRQRVFSYFTIYFLWKTFRLNNVNVNNNGNMKYRYFPLHGKVSNNKCCFFFLRKTMCFRYFWPGMHDPLLLYGCVSQGLGTTEFTNLIGWNRYWPWSRFSHVDRHLDRSHFALKK